MCALKPEVPESLRYHWVFFYHVAYARQSQSIPANDMQHTHFIDVNQLINIIPVVSNAILSESLGLWHRRHRRVLYSVLTVRQHCITVFGVTQTL